MRLILIVLLVIMIEFIKKEGSASADELISIEMITDIPQRCVET